MILSTLFTRNIGISQVIISHDIVINRNAAPLSLYEGSWPPKSCFKFCYVEPVSFIMKKKLEQQNRNWRCSNFCSVHQQTEWNLGKTQLNIIFYEYWCNLSRAKIQSLTSARILNRLKSFNTRTTLPVTLQAWKKDL